MSRGVHVGVWTGWPKPFLFLGKVDRVVAEQLQSFLENALILEPLQSGSQLGHGMETAFVALTDGLQIDLY